MLSDLWPGRLRVIPDADISEDGPVKRLLLVRATGQHRNWRFLRSEYAALKVDKAGRIKPSEIVVYLAWIMHRVLENV